MRRRARIIPFPTTGRTLPSAGEPFVEVLRCGQAEAVVARGLLHSEGIPTRVRSRLSHTVHPFTVGEQGEVVILVPASAAARSRRLLGRGRARRSLG